MTEWRLSQRDLKRYPHFDQILKMSEIGAIVTNPVRVAQNKFYPLLHYAKGWQPFRPDPASGKPRPKPKSRPIRYAARRDSYIFSYYRHLLSAPYESELTRLGVSDCPIAYRRIPTASDGRRGKCNIHFAREAFDAVRRLENCCTIAIDISSYFDSIDHARLFSLWCKMLGVSRLPNDHFAVYKNVTQYRYVERLAAYERLGFYGEKGTTKAGVSIKGYLTPYKDLPTQLCSPADFRLKIVGEGGQYPSLVQLNKDPFGIAQGVPISDLLANLYLIDFDVEMNGLAKRLGGTYLRYSDDILLILPVDPSAATSIMHGLPAVIKKYGNNLLIKPEKSSLVQYVKEGTRQRASSLTGNPSQRGLEYLGFRYDGQNVYLRDATLSNLHRKIAYAARNQANATIRRYPTKGYADLCDKFNFEEFTKRFGRVERFEPSLGNKRWTFWTYVARAREEFGPCGRTISSQLRHLRRRCRHRVDVEIARALERRSRSDATQD